MFHLPSAKVGGFLFSEDVVFAQIMINYVRPKSSEKSRIRCLKKRTARITQTKFVLQAVHYWFRTWLDQGEKNNLKKVVNKFGKTI